MSKNRKKKATKTGREKNKTFSISLSMIVKNEEKFLEDCLISVQKLVDEIIIIDTGSSDNTKKIAEKYGAKIYDHEWKNDFSEARNFALQKTSGDWIIYLDADERLPEKYHPDVKRLIHSNRHDALLTKIRSEVSGPLGTIPHFQTYPRIFRNKANIKFVYPVHEQILPSLMDQKFRMVQTGIMIDHLGYAQEDEIIHSKIDRNRLFLEQQIENEPENAYAHYQLAQTLRLIPNRENEAFAMYEISISLAKNQPGIIATALLQLASIKLNNKKYEDALNYIEKSLKTSTTQAYGFFMKAETLFLMEKYTEALPVFENIEKLNKISFEKRISELLTEKEIPTDLLIKRIISCYINTENLNKACKKFENEYKNISIWNNSWVAIVSAILHVGTNNDIPFDEIFNKIVSNNGENEQQIRIVENILQVEKWLQYPQVVKWIDGNIEKIALKNPEYRYYFAQVFFNVGNFEKCYEFITSYTIDHADEITALELQGTVEIKIGNLNRAIFTYEQLLNLNKNNIQYFKILGGLFAKIGNLEKASEIALQLKSLMEK